MPAYLLEALMPQRSPREPIRPQPGRRELTDRINRAFVTSDIDEIRHAIGAAIRRYNISDIAKASGLERPTIYRAFEGDDASRPWSVPSTNRRVRRIAGVRWRGWAGV
jgi:hypothetical protein